MKTILLFTALLFSSLSFGQTFPTLKVGDGAPIDASAALEVKSTTKAVLFPRMTTTQKNAITAANGDMVYDTTLGLFSVRQGGAWVSLAATSGVVSSVALSMPSIFGVSGSPITSSGTFSVTLTGQTANKVLASPNGSTGTPFFRSLVSGDIPTILIDSFTDTSLDWDQRKLYDFNSVESEDWHNRYLVDTGTTISVDWASRILRGTSGEKSIDWYNRRLYDSSENIKLSWGTSGVNLPNLTASKVVFTDGSKYLTSTGTVGIPQGGTGQVTQSAAFDALSPMTTLGDTIYGGASGTGTRLAGNTTSTKKFYSQTGTGVVSAAPAWNQPACSDLSNGAASCSTDTTNASNISSGTLPAGRLPNPSSSTLGGVQSYAAVSNQWINTISTSGVPASSQPTFSNISGTVAASQLPNPSASTLGGIQSYAAVSNQWINTISTSGVPSSTQPAFSNISGTVAASQLPNPSASTLGGIQSYAAVSSQWIRSISTSGVPASSQPAFSDISGTASLTTQVTGTLPTGNGGTGQASNWTAGGTIYASSTTVLASTATGSTGQVLTSNGTGTAPTYQAVSSAPTSTYFSGYFSSASSWDTTSTSFVDGTNAGGNALTTIYSNGITVTAAASNICGITFTPASSTAVYWIFATIGFNNQAAASGVARMTDGTTAIDPGKDATGGVSITLMGIYAPGTASAVTVKIQQAGSGGNHMFIENLNSLAKPVTWGLVQIK